MRNLVACLILLCACSLNAGDISIIRPRSYLREGPAAYYEIITELPINSRVKLIRSGPVWMQVQYQKKSGYISASSTQKAKGKSDPFTNLPPPSALTTSQGVTAGVKGFCTKFNQQFQVNSTFPDLALATGVNVAEYQKFYRNSLQGRKLSQFQKMFPNGDRRFVDFYSEAAEGFGLSIASIIAAQGLYKNPPLANYLNLLGTYLASAADTPEIQYRFFILDISQPNAYACPGGYIFISKGMLQLVSSEAELAFVLAHEIAHVSRFHGMKDVKLLENQIGAQDVFDELDRDIEGFKPFKNKEIEAELEKDILDMRDTLVQGRLDQYEQEADNLAMLFMARCAYNPFAGIDLLTKLQNTRYESNNQHYTKKSVAQRLELCHKNSGRFNHPKLRYIDDNPRFSAMKQLLDTN